MQSHLSPPAGDTPTLPGIFSIAEQSPRCLELTTHYPDAAISAASGGKKNWVGAGNVKRPVI